MSKYVTDKYVEALTSINKEIEKHAELRSNLPINSKEYRNNLEEEIKLENKKSELLRDL